MPADAALLDELVSQVMSGTKYSFIDPGLVRSLGQKELAKRASLKEAVKSTRNKLHQIGSAYQEQGIPYSNWISELNRLPVELHSPQVEETLVAWMGAHASTRERLAIHREFYAQILVGLGPLHSVLDLACGLNPLNLPWMPVADDIEYHACDIYTDMRDFLNTFFRHFNVNGKAFCCDLTQTIPDQPVQLALLLKTIPCLEQVDKQIGVRLLQGLQAENILVTFPAHSLGGRSKGMVTNYAAHFAELSEGKSWQITRFDFPGELVFLIRK